MAQRRKLLGMTVLSDAGLFGLLARYRAAKAAQPVVFPVTHTDAEWRSLLGPAAYDVLRRQGTEIPFSSRLDFQTRAGTYFCAGCALPLFSSATKYGSHTGWPSFWQPLRHAVAESNGRATTPAMGAGDARVVQCNGSAWRLPESSRRRRSRSRCEKLRWQRRPARQSKRRYGSDKIFRAIPLPVAAATE